MRNIFLADNQYITQEGVCALLNRKGETSIRFAGTKQALLEGLHAWSESYVVLDYILFDFKSVDELIILQERFPAVKWLLFSAELSTEFLREIYFNAPNFSILYKDSSEHEVEAAFSDFLEGKRYMGSIVSNALLNNLYKQNTETRKAHLTTTEKEILIDMASGKTTKEIAQIRHISTHTVVTHRKNIFRKIDVNNVYEATKYAVKAGLIDLADYFI